MLTRRSVIIRLTLCVLLGAVMAWMVAWALEVGVWASRIAGPQLRGPGSYTTRGPEVVHRSEYAARSQVKERWTLLRLDRNDAVRDYARGQLWEWSGGAEGTVSPMLSLGRQQHPSRQASLPRRQDQIAKEFDAMGLSRSLGESAWTVIDATSDGWPWKCVTRLEVSTIYPRTEQTRWALEFKEFTRLDPDWGTLVPLRLPLRPRWPALLLNTAFYGALWALLFFGLMLLKQTRRRRKGRCPRCAYDLKRDLEQGCPECGWGR